MTTNGAFLEAWEEYTGVNEEACCCPDKATVSQVTIVRKRPTVEKGSDAKRKEMDTIDANIEVKKYGKTAFFVHSLRNKKPTYIFHIYLGEVGNDTIVLPVTQCMPPALSRAIRGTDKVFLERLKENMRRDPYGYGGAVAAVLCTSVNTKESFKLNMKGGYR